MTAQWHTSIGSLVGKILKQPGILVSLRGRRMRSACVLRRPWEAGLLEFHRDDAQRSGYLPDDFRRRHRFGSGRHHSGGCGLRGKRGRRRQRREPDFQRARQRYRHRAVRVARHPEDHTGRRLPIQVFGNGSNNTIAGNSGANFIDGGAGDDTIDGGAGNDTIVYSGGTNSLKGGDGNDLFQISSGGGSGSINGGSETDTVSGYDLGSLSFSAVEILESAAAKNAFLGTAVQLSSFGTLTDAAHGRPIANTPCP